MCITGNGRIIIGGEPTYMGDSYDKKSPFYYSSDNGATWNDLSFKSSAADICNCVYYDALSSKLYAAISYSSTHRGIWYSSDNGNTWLLKVGSDNSYNWQYIFRQGGTLYCSSTSNSSTYHGTFIYGSLNKDYNWYVYGQYLTDDGKIGIYTCRDSNLNEMLACGGECYRGDAALRYTLMQSYAFNSVCITKTGRVLALSGNGQMLYSDTLNVPAEFANDKYLTGEQAKELVRQCKEYVQAKKLELQQNNG